MNASCPDRRRLLGLMAGALLLPAAHALEAPRGKVVLTLSGRITRPNAGAQADFDEEMLRRLPQHSFRTATPWHPGRPEFSGPLLRDVLDAAGAQGELLVCTALNDYRAEVPRADAQQWPVILALRVDGQPMTVRNKGPVFLVYPYDSDPALRSEKYYNRSPWQLRRIELR